MADESDKASPTLMIPFTEEFPVLVDEEGKPKVVISFIVGPDSRVSHLHIDESSGNKDIDNAIVETFSRWKFPNLNGKDQILGTLTYKVNPIDEQ